MTVRSQIHTSLSRHFQSGNFAQWFSVRDAWKLIEPEGLASSSDALRIHLNVLWREGKITKQKRSVTEDYGTHSRAFYSLLTCVEEESSPEHVNLPITSPPEPVEADGDDLGDFFRMIRDALLDRDVVAFSITEAGDIEYEQRIVRKRSLSLT